VTMPAGTTTHGQSHPTGSPEGNPDDHADRPVNAKPTTTTSTPASTSVTSKPNEDDKATSPESTGKPNLLPSIFPTFGVSKKTQVWIYGSFALIVIFGVSLGAWYLVTRRRAYRNSRDEYEFEMLNEEDAHDDDARGGLINPRKNRRAGELYDAFAEGSEDEDVFSVGDEDDEDEQRYRDDREGEKSA